MPRRKRQIPPVDMIEIKACSQLQQKIRGDASKSKKWGWDLPLIDFAMAMLCLNPQTAGSRVEMKLSDYLGLEPTDNEECGDRMSILGKYIEWKGSFFTSSNRFLNAVQIRPWQDIDLYVLYVFDFRNLDNGTMQLFVLSKKQMESELDKATFAHGTKIANLNNANNELAVRIEADSDTYNRWVAEYGISLDALNTLLNSPDMVK